MELSTDNDNALTGAHIAYLPYYTFAEHWAHTTTLLQLHQFVWLFYIQYDFNWEIWFQNQFGGEVSLWLLISPHRETGWFCCLLFVLITANVYSGLAHHPFVLLIPIPHWNTVSITDIDKASCFYFLLTTKITSFHFLTCTFHIFHLYRRHPWKMCDYCFVLINLFPYFLFLAGAFACSLNTINTLTVYLMLLTESVTLTDELLVVSK